MAAWVKAGLAAVLVATAVIAYTSFHHVVNEKNQGTSPSSMLLGVKAPLPGEWDLTVRGCQDCRVVELEDGVDVFADGMVVWGRWEDTVNETGWAHLTVQSSASYPDHHQAHSAGFFEGYVSALRISQMFQNFLGLDFHGEKISPKLTSFLTDQLSFLRKMAKKETNYWKHVSLILEQFDGLVEGYQLAAKQQGLLALTELDLYMLNSYGDLEDLELIFPSASGPLTAKGKLGPEQFLDCSALIKFLPDKSDLMVAHTTWTGYGSMLRVFKHYNLNYNTEQTTAKWVSFSSKPGMLSSKDDFYVMDSGLVTQETTNAVFNKTLYDLVVPTTCPCWLRAVLSNRMAKDSKEWTELFRTLNSGTYNNQWMAVNMNLFKAGQDLPDKDLLWIVEQLPGYTESRDVTLVLKNQTYWSSFNIPYLKEVYDRAGYPAKAKEFPNEYVHDTCPRANIFRREQAKIHDLSGMKHTMQFNEWQDDPFSLGSPENTISSRYDLIPDDLKRPKKAFGGVDSKITSFKLAKKQYVQAISGPTHQEVPPFKWSDGWEDEPHVGLPEVYDFDWELQYPDIVGNGQVKYKEA